METETKKPRVYQLQTKLYHVEDVLVTWGPLRLTLRQCLVLVLGGCGTLNAWQFLDALGAGEFGVFLRILLSCPPSLLGLLLAVVKVADRYAEAWAWVLFEYALGASVYLSRPSQSCAPQPKGKRQCRDKQEGKTGQKTSKNEQQEEDEDYE